MNILDEINTSKDLRIFWEKIVGKELLDKLIENTEFRNNELYTKRMVNDADLEEFIKFESVKTVILAENHLFRPFCQKLYMYTMIKLQNLQLLLNKELMHGLTCEIIESLNIFYIRCLIDEMHQLKKTGMLIGADSIEEYRFYENHYLASHSFQSKLFQKYPVMTELIIYKIKKYLEYISEIVEHMVTDKDAIVINLCDHKEFINVKDIQLGRSDEHISGKTVAKIILDNGYAVYYKPHDLKSNISYNTVYAWISELCGLKSYEYKGINRCNYSWEMEIKYEQCHHEAEIERYYRRMGIQLCLAYVFNITDLHIENIIAHGEYPIIIDLEIFPDRHINLNSKLHSMEDLLKDTVMNTGLLPGNTLFGNDVNVSAFGSSETKKASFKVPMIANRGTSDMSIYYDYPEVKIKNMLLKLNGIDVDYKNYIHSMMEGFQTAYSCMIKNRKVINLWGKKIIRQRSRYLLRNTQEYTMYQMSSNFPEFMMRQDCRCLMLYRMNSGLKCNEKYRKEILRYEMECIFHFIIPVYYACDKDLYLGNGTKLPEYFSPNIKNSIAKKIEKLSQKDLELQKKVIETAFLPYLKADIKAYKKYLEKTKKYIEITPHGIAEVVIADMQVYGDGRFGWLGISYNKAGRRSLTPVDIYLYNGLCGITIFLTAMYQKYKDKKYNEISTKLIQILFSHTQEIQEQSFGWNNCPWGLFTGEASIVYTYLILYQITGDHILLEYAMSHSDMIIQHLDDIKGPDLLDGKAGLIIILLVMYSKNQNNRYLDAAVYLGAMLINEAVQMDVGIGWMIEGQQKPLAGMAHGNSGIALAFAYLCKYANKKYYGEMLEKIIAYEDSLYDEKLGNWLDLRAEKQVPGEAVDTVAWCHGAGGILISRIGIYQITGRWYNYKLVECAVNKLRNTVKMDMCLCHGNEGLKAALRMWDESDKYMSACLNVRQGNGLLSIEDRVSPGFMIGMSGIGYGLMIDMYQEFKWFFF